MLPAQTLDKLHALKLPAVAQAWTEQQQNAELVALSFDERLGLLVDAEWLARENKRLVRALQEAKLKLPHACIEAIDYPARRALREAQARPVLGRFKTWLDEQAGVVLPKSPIGEAVHYARAQWTALTRYVEDGALAIDNNAAERALRRVCTGRKNWLFCGSDEGGTRAAILYSVVATCKAHAVDVWAYLKDVLERIPTHPNRRRAELLPRNWTASQAAATQP